MELGTFLEPGLYDVHLLDLNKQKVPWGFVCHRHGRRLSWLSKVAHPANSLLCLSLDLQDFTIAEDGALMVEVGNMASLKLVGEVEACRSLVKDEVYVLRFKSLVRLLDEES
ncbi:MAG: hypothetical protein LBE27_04855 [Deltaproteobacteria bacterium]|jgi:hypothetical protein|nr:hypothetical protein [Deltaproteobacteria bacterium]